MINGSQRSNLMKIYNPHKVGVIKINWQYSMRLSGRKLPLQRGKLFYMEVNHITFNSAVKGILWWKWSDFTGACFDPWGCHRPLGIWFHNTGLFLPTTQNITSKWQKESSLFTSWCRQEHIKINSSQTSLTGQSACICQARTSPKWHFMKEQDRETCQASQS